MTTYSTSLQLNQFQQKYAKGQADSIVEPNTLPCQIDPDSADTFYAGDSIKIVSSVGRTIIIALAAITDPVDGVIAYNQKKDSFTAGDHVEVLMKDSVVVVEAGEAISRGDYVEWYPTGNSYKKSAGVYPVCGRALDNAGGNHDLFRIWVLGAQKPILGADGQVGGLFVAVTAGATPALNCAKGRAFTLTPAETETISASNVDKVKGRSVNLIITTSGTQFYILTFGTNIKSTGTLNTGATNAKVFTVSFISDGTQLIETSRTTAQ